MYICRTAGNVLFCRPKENQKGRRYPEGMKAPVGLLNRRPVCEANAACSARQGHGDFDALAARREMFSFGTKREPERTAVPGGHESPSGAFKPQTGLRSKCRVFSAARSQRFRCAYSRAEFVLFWHQKRTRKVPAISTRWIHESRAARP